MKPAAIAGHSRNTTKIARNGARNTYGAIRGPRNTSRTRRISASLDHSEGSEGEGEELPRPLLVSSLGRFDGRLGGRQGVRCGDTVVHDVVDQGGGEVVLDLGILRPGEFRSHVA